MQPDQLASYREAIAQYHLHPEAKFLNADYLDTGTTRRRHIFATRIAYIGKEANRWEEQFFVGLDEEAAIEYGSTPEARTQLAERVREGIRRLGQQAAARAAHMSLRDVSLAAREGSITTVKMLLRLDRVLTAVEAGMDHTA